ncbi:MAG: hypothetical protein R3F34_01315 [Planctomycetota bacterium]
MIIQVRRAETRVGRGIVDALRAEGVHEVRVGDDGPEACDVVLDAGLRPAGIDAVRAALEGGSHWVDLCWRRGWASEVAALDERARELDRAAVCSAGAFCGLTDPFVRAASEKLVRTNEVLLGVAAGDPGELDEESFAMLLEDRDRTVRMLIGGEWSERRFFGDTRTFFFPKPFGDRQGSNVDVVDLEHFTGKGVRSASVRLTVAPPSGLALKAARAFLALAHRGRIREPERKPARVASWLRRLGGRGPWCLGIVVRGLGDTRLPVESRTAFAPPKGRAEVLSVAPALEIVRSLAESPRPGAGPPNGRVAAKDLESRLATFGVGIVRGDLGGWRGEAVPRS